MDLYFLISLGVGVILIILERLIPARPLPHVQGWWLRVVIINVIQATVIFGFGSLWAEIFSGSSVLQLKEWNIWASAFAGYFVITFVFYWWHRWRHQVYWLWRIMHQIHHSANRIETITSFYKHPIEITFNSIIISFIVFSILGMSPASVAILNFLMCLAEYLYHMNIRTPHWYGYIFQRPESHRVHHQRGRHTSNFSDLPIWDIFFGTFNNPKYDVECGFHPEREARFTDMLLFKEVNRPIRRIKKL